MTGSLEEMDEALDSCLTVHSGISNQYLYRSLYGVQIQHCLKVYARAINYNNIIYVFKCIFIGVFSVTVYILFDYVYLISVYSPKQDIISAQ